MDANEFSFEALFECPEFDFYEDKEFKKSYAELRRIIECDMKENELGSRLGYAADKCIQNARANSFKQGFSFAVRSIKFILKI